MFLCSAAALASHREPLGWMRITQKPRRRLFPIRFFFSIHIHLSRVVSIFSLGFFFFFVSPSSHPSCLRCTSNGDKYLSCSVLSARATPRISCLLKHEQSRQFILLDERVWGTEGECSRASAGQSPATHSCVLPLLEVVLPPESNINQPLLFFFFISDSSFSLWVMTLDGKISLGKKYHFLSFF